MIPDKIKAHFERNKNRYYVGSFVGIAVITVVIMRGRHADFLRSSDTAATTVFMRPLNFLFFSKQNFVTVIAREGRGHPGYLVWCRETGDAFLSQAKAASWAEVSEANMSLHLRGKFPDIHGLHFERITV